MIRVQVGCAGLLVCGTQYLFVLARRPVTDLDRLFRIAPSGVLFRQRNVGTPDRRKFAHIEMFPIRWIHLVRAGEVGNVVRSNVRRRILAWVEK